MKCKNCNSEISNDAKFCGNCGLSLDKEEQRNMNENNYSNDYSNTSKKLKSPGLAFILGFLFGAFGLLYISFKQALWAFIILFLIALITGGSGLILWFACGIWGYFAAKSYNEKI